MIDLSAPCMGETNYEASVDLSGGTPGKPNSVNRVLADTSLPRIADAFITDEQTIQLLFSKAMHPDTIGTVSVKSMLSDFMFTVQSVSFTNEQLINITISQYLSLKEAYELRLQD